MEVSLQRYPVPGRHFLKQPFNSKSAVAADFPSEEDEQVPAAFIAESQEIRKGPTVTAEPRVPCLQSSVPDVNEDKDANGEKIGNVAHQTH